MSHRTAVPTWTGRNDGSDPGVQRWHQRVRVLPLAKESAAEVSGSLCFIGYPTDAGVRANAGRAGAAAGPAALRRAMGSLPCHGDWPLADVGDIEGSGSVEAQQERLGAAVGTVVAGGGRPLVLGGGHDCGYGTWRGAFEALGPRASAGLLSINIDAHLDNRPVASGAHSGTSYTQIREHCDRVGVPFRAIALGIQRMSNTQLLFERAARAGLAVVSRDEVATGAFTEPLLAALAGAAAGTVPIHLSIDLDALSIALAPGVSAPNAAGLGVADVLRVLDAIPWGRVVAVDIAELAPGLDADDRTARTAAALAFEVAERWMRA